MPVRRPAAGTNHSNESLAVNSRLFVVAVLLAAGLPAAAQEPRKPMPGLVADPASGCKVWAPNPGPQETIGWSGACDAGLVEGAGTMQWFSAGTPNGTYEGTTHNGRYDGRGTLKFADGGMTANGATACRTARAAAPTPAAIAMTATGATAIATAAASSPGRTEAATKARSATTTTWKARAYRRRRPRATRASSISTSPTRPRHPRLLERRPLRWPVAGRQIFPAWRVHRRRPQPLRRRIPRRARQRARHAVVAERQPLRRLLRQRLASRPGDLRARRRTAL